MMALSIFRLSFILLICFLFSACSQDDVKAQPEPKPVRSLSALESEVVNSASEFTLDLMTEIDHDFPDENYFISSLSVSTAVSMVMNGANEPTQDQFINSLRLEGMSAEEVNEAYQSLVEYIYALDPSVTIALANSNWYHNEYTVKEAFANILKEYYDAEIFGKNFRDVATLGAINGWIEDHTNGKIKDVIGSISPDDVMYLINAIYFKAPWTNTFDKANTADRPFFLKDKSLIYVPTMSGKTKHWVAYWPELESQIIEIPYGNENYGLTIVMPNNSADIDGLIARMDVNQLNEVLKDTILLSKELELPKMKIEFKADIKKNLVDMGMPVTGFDNLFEEALPLRIGKVIHQSFLEVNEEGSEAAAVTVITIELTSVPSPTKVNRPFVFFIRERNSNTILFSGKMINPTL